MLHYTCLNHRNLKPLSCHHHRKERHSSPQVECVGHWGPGQVRPLLQAPEGCPQPCPSGRGAGTAPWRCLAQIRPDRCSPQGWLRGQTPAAGDREKLCHGLCPAGTGPAPRPRGSGAGAGQVDQVGRAAAARSVGCRRPQGSLMRRQRARRWDRRPGRAGVGGQRAQVGRELQAVGGGALAVT